MSLNTGRDSAATSRLREFEFGDEDFEALRRLFRPWYAGRDAVRPRLWDT